MTSGLWVWPSGPKGQRKVLSQVAASRHLTAAMMALAKSKEGLSNAELDDAINDNSEWMTLWVIRQLTSLGFIEFKIDLFGDPAKYRLTELGRQALSTITGQPLQKPPSPAPALAAAPAVPQPAAPRTA
ncbi:MAG TPA: hypothetical protein VGR56_04915 [Nitrososphaerales archaeon]|nr:hypothetical protein [Nitrososphaerales archaeon]